MTEKPSVTLPGTVEKIIPPADPDQVEKAQIAIEGADVDVTVEADQEVTTATDREKH
jgi:hypothetical protein